MGCPQAFPNLGTMPARVIFLVSPPGHEQVLGTGASLGRHA